MSTIILLLTAFQLYAINSQLYTCNHIQYRTEEVVVINQCISSRVNGITTSKIISCVDNIAEKPVFTEYVYHNERCTGNPASTQQITTPIMSHNCNGNDCNQIFRLYNTIDNTPTCNKASDFEDIAVIRGYKYNINTFIGDSCTLYDCIKDQNRVSVIDCLDSAADIIYTNGICDPTNNTYFDSLIHCGPFNAYTEIIPKVPTRYPTKSPITNSPSFSPFHIQTHSPNNNESQERIEMSSTYTEHISTTLAETNNGENRTDDFGENNGKIFILPAIATQVLAFIIILLLFYFSIHHLFINKKKTKKREIHMKPLVIFIFIFNVCAIALQIGISIIMYLFAYNIKTQFVIYIIYYAALICYVLGKCCLELVFISRVYNAFKNNIYGLSKIHLYILSIWMSVVSVSWLILMLIDNRYGNNLHYLYIPVTTLDVLLTVYILYLFIKRLKNIIIQEAILMRDGAQRQRLPNKLTPVPSATPGSAMTSSTPQPNLTLNISEEPKLENAFSNTVNELKKESVNSKRLWPVCCKYDVEDIKSVKQDLKSNSSLIFLMTKLTLLSGISLITTTVFGMYLSYEMFVKETFIVFILWSLDICINSICLFLNFSFSNNVYKMCCNGVHKICQTMMENIFVSKIMDEHRKDEESMHKIQSVPC
eukprot:72167_1